ncbi:Protein kinase-like domain protein [Beauveria brongniartii RCEF 3172]|uniref:Protein kinase-like domain protein n=1 Tax=Beauveria brongniartii RCEF 3172 TaxID=1081107 RepID=A0A166YDD8_9HYPO|nr:Protein kinase-like domain protein [Beauveria brongniartii RCEF 3172]
MPPSPFSIIVRAFFAHLTGATRRLLAFIWKPKQITEVDADGSDASKAEEGLEPGTKILLMGLLRKVVLLEPSNTVVKSGRCLDPAEADALKVANGANIPSPRLHSVLSQPHLLEIRMDYVPGQTLEELWPSMSTDEKKSAATQLRGIIQQMQAIEPPPNYIGRCNGTGVRDTRVRITYDGPVCKDEAEFNEYLISSLFHKIPSVLRTSIRDHLQTDHRIVFTHGDLAPRNIMMQDGKISGIVDWEDAGWYPEYWELIKFIERPAKGDWKQYAEIIFPKHYPTELIAYTAISKWRYG